MNNTQKSSSGKWFWGIFISLILIVLIFVGISFLILAKSISHRSGKTYYYETKGSGSGKIAIVDLDYTIISSESIVRQFKKYREDKSIKAILLRIDSPGGGVAASQEMYEEVKKTRDSGKPVVVSVGSIAASGGYYVACGSSLIVANPGSITGSIGVIAQFINIREMADKLGIKETTIKSGDLKDSGNPFRDMNESDRQYFQEIVMDCYDQFLNVVSMERKIDIETLKGIANGRVFTGKQAKEMNLIDTLGTYEDAIKITAKLANIEGDPVIVKEKVRKLFLEMFLESISNSGLNGLKEQIKNEYIDRPILQYKLEKID